ncbi:MAG: hypothetical protein ACRBDL_10040 [Alphaproteobacteria bacterium]
MKITAQEFLNSSRKAVTLIGMSGAGKTHISCQLQAWGWENYSCDYEIGAKFLKDELTDVQSLSTEDIGALSTFLGKLGSPEKDGFDMDLFKTRQKAYYDAEVLALQAMQSVVEGTQGHFVHDSTGSLCEIGDDELLRQIGEKTLFVYLKTDEETEKEVLQRAQDYPKPLFFPPAFLQEKVQTFLNEQNLDSVSDVMPDDFSRWVFPLLFEARKPKYQRLADLYGVTVPATEFRDLSSSDEFIKIIAQYL